MRSDNSTTILIVGYRLNIIIFINLKKKMSICNTLKHFSFCLFSYPAKHFATWIATYVFTRTP